MRFKTMASLAVLALGASMAFAAPASAQVARGAPAIAATDDGLLQNVQYRRHYRGGYNRGYHRGYHRRHDPGAAVAAGIIGLAAGAIIAGAASAPPPPPARDPAWVDYCFSKYRSFDPVSGTYLGYDGLRHYCQ